MGTALPIITRQFQIFTRREGAKLGKWCQFYDQITIQTARRTLRLIIVPIQRDVQLIPEISVRRWTTQRYGTATDSLHERNIKLRQRVEGNAGPKHRIKQYDRVT